MKREGERDQGKRTQVIFTSRPAVKGTKASKEAGKKKAIQNSMLASAQRNSTSYKNTDKQTRAQLDKGREKKGKINKPFRMILSREYKHQHEAPAIHTTTMYYHTTLHLVWM